MTLFVAALATAGATRLIVNDEFPFGPFRRWVGRTFDSKVADVVDCPWCISGWLSLAVTIAVWATQGLALPPVAWFAVWAAGKLIYFATEALAKAASPDDPKPTGSLADRLNP